MSVLVGLNFPLRVEEVQCPLEKSSPVLGTNFPVASSAHSEVYFSVRVPCQRI